MIEENLRSTEAAPAAEPLPAETTTDTQSCVDTPPIAIEPLAPKNEVPSDITRRLAEEFFELREEFPALHSPEQLPDAVLDLAVKKNIPLFDAYLRFRYEEEKRVRREEERRRQAAADAVGSLMQGEADANLEQDAFLRAFRTALK
jgi:hypothetical protein